VRRRVTLARQLLALQLLILLAVMVGVTAVSITQSAETIRRAEGRRALSAAENIAATPIVRDLLPTAQPRVGAVLPATAESRRSLSGARSVVLARLDGTVVTSTDPQQVGTRMSFGDAQVVRGRSWTGLVRAGDATRVSAQVAVQDGTDGRVVGVAVVEREYPSTLELAQRVKRQTLGLEPREIAGLVEHREAMLHGVKEGVIGLDNDHRITLVNDSACQLVGIPFDSTGRLLEDLNLDPQLTEVLTGRRTGTDQAVLVEDRVLTLNRNPMSSRGRVLGSVTTLRDRTELTALRRELGVVRHATDTLRAQTHEFANQLHVISGLVQLREYDEVVRFIDAVSRGRAELDEDVTGRVRDPALAALLIAKASLAAERGVDLRFAPTASLGRVDEALSGDLTTVVGNLVDNALDAVSSGQRLGAEPGWVEVDFREDGADVVVQVRDSGPGVEPGIADQVFERGFSTKPSDDAVGRGFGLALTGLVCRRRGGEVSVRNEDGAVFTARLPRTLVPS
jgi:two-component system CitB family sensor kinase